MGYTVFKRTYAAPVKAAAETNNGEEFEDEKKEEREVASDDDTETFEQCIDRMLQSGLIQHKCQFSQQDESLLRTLLLDQKCSLSGRCLQSLGISSHAGNNNFLPLSSCAFTKVAHPIEPFVYTMRMSSYGVGVGFSVESIYVDQLPNVVASLQIKRSSESDAVWCGMCNIVARKLDSTIGYHPVGLLWCLIHW